MNARRSLTPEMITPEMIRLVETRGKTFREKAEILRPLVEDLKEYDFDGVVKYWMTEEGRAFVKDARLKERGFRFSATSKMDFGWQIYFFLINDAIERFMRQVTF